MNKIINRLLVFISTIILCFNIGSYAKAGIRSVVDEASLFNNEEITNLENNIKEIINKYNMDVVIVTTNILNGKSSKEYADDFFDYGGYGLENNSGILLLINMFDREIYISTKGECIKIFTDTTIDSILDEIYTYLPDEKYFRGAEVFLEKVRYSFKDIVTDGQGAVKEGSGSNDGSLNAGVSNNVENDTKEDGISDNNSANDGQEAADNSNPQLEDNSSSVVWLAGIVAIIVCGIVFKKYKFPSTASEKSYIDESSINFTKRIDRLVTSDTTRKRIKKDNSSRQNVRTTNTTGSKDRRAEKYNIKVDRAVKNNTTSRKFPKNNNNSSGGGSTTHTSSSGNSHGGGGRSF